MSTDFVFRSLLDALDGHELATGYDPEDVSEVDDAERRRLASAALAAAVDASPSEWSGRVAPPAAALAAALDRAEAEAVEPLGTADTL